MSMTAIARLAAVKRNFPARMMVAGVTLAILVLAIAIAPAPDMAGLPVLTGP
jgi:hypothetical protein